MSRRTPLKSASTVLSRFLNSPAVPYSIRDSFFVYVRSRGCPMRVVGFKTVRFQSSVWLCYGLFFFATLFLLGGLLPPVFVKTGQPTIADCLYEVFSASCQQQSTRTFWMLGYPMALCARCLGAYCGFAGLALYSVVRKQIAIAPIIVLLSALLAFGEKVMEWTLWPANNALRFIAGIGLGFLVFIFVSWVMGFVIIRIKENATTYLKARSGL
jgi:uncharacterized membrane protein